MISREEAPENLVGELIRRQRELAELSMRQVAAMAGISNPYLSQIEHGLRAPSADVLEGIAATLGVPVDSLRPRTSDEDRAFDGADDHERAQTMGSWAMHRDPPRSMLWAVPPARPW